jgi:hypothetical protein
MKTGYHNVKKGTFLSDRKVLGLAAVRGVAANLDIRQIPQRKNDVWCVKI